MNKNQVFVTNAWDLMTETLMVKKLAYILAVVYVSVFSSEENELQIGNNFLSFFAKTTRLKINFTSISGKNVADKIFVQVTKPWTLYWGSVVKNKRSNVKNSQNRHFFHNFLQKNKKLKLVSANM